MTEKLNDCYFYYYSACTKGANCPFRHSEASLGSEVVCLLWRQGQCFNHNCKLRHMEIQKNRNSIPCYWEGQPGGCTKPHCPFQHFRPRRVPPPPFFPGFGVPPPPFPPPGFIPGPGYPGQLDTSGDFNMYHLPNAPPIQPIIVNPNEVSESDPESMPSSSPVKRPFSNLRSIPIEHPPSPEYQRDRSPSPYRSRDDRSPSPRYRRRSRSLSPLPYRDRSSRSRSHSPGVYSRDRPSSRGSDDKYGYSRSQGNSPEHSRGSDRRDSESDKATSRPKVITVKKDDNIKAEPGSDEEEDEDGVRSLEDIYRERALQSLLAAKRKKVAESKKAKLLEKAAAIRSQKGFETKRESPASKPKPKSGTISLKSGPRTGKISLTSLSRRGTSGIRSEVKRAPVVVKSEVKKKTISVKPKHKQISPVKPKQEEVIKETSGDEMEENEEGSEEEHEEEEKGSGEEEEIEEETKEEEKKEEEEEDIDIMLREEEEITLEAGDLEEEEKSETQEDHGSSAESASEEEVEEEVEEVEEEETEEESEQESEEESSDITEQTVADVRKAIRKERPRSPVTTVILPKKLQAKPRSVPLQSLDGSGKKRRVVLDDGERKKLSSTVTRPALKPHIKSRLGITPKASQKTGREESKMSVKLRLGLGRKREASVHSDSDEEQSQNVRQKKIKLRLSANDKDRTSLATISGRLRQKESVKRKSVKDRLGESEVGKKKRTTIELLDEELENIQKTNVRRTSKPVKLKRIEIKSEVQKPVHSHSKRSKSNVLSRLGPQPESSSDESDEEEEIEEKDLEEEVSPDEPSSEEEEGSDQDMEDLQRKKEILKKKMSALSKERKEKKRQEKAVKSLSSWVMKNKKITVKATPTSDSDGHDDGKPAIKVKSLEEIRKEKALKKHQRKDEEKPEVTKPTIRPEVKPKIQQQVKLVVRDENDDDDPDMSFEEFRRRRLQLMKDKQKEERTLFKKSKKERQIYVPPARKRTGTPTVEETSLSEDNTPKEVSVKPKVPTIKSFTRQTVAPVSTNKREIINYADIFPKTKSAVVSSASDTAVMSASPSKSGGEVGIRSFSEIMAEKRRRRLEAQQNAQATGVKKPFKPVVFDLEEQDQPDSPAAQTGQTTVTTAPAVRDSDVLSRLSPQEFVSREQTDITQVQSETDFNKQKTETAQPIRVSSRTAVSAESAKSSTRWKRRKAEVVESSVTPEPLKISSITPEPLKISNFTREPLKISNVTPEPLKSSNLTPAPVPAPAPQPVKVEEVKPEPAVSVPVTTAEVRPVVQEKKPPEVPVKPREEKNSDSFLDLDDELLGIDDDFDLADEQSHDDLLREMDELLA